MRFFKRISVLVLAIFLCFSMAVPCLAKDETTMVRIGYFPLGHFYEVDDSGTVGGYEASYLEKISQSSSLSFTYVSCASWNDALDKLNRHEIDLIGTMQKTPERLQQYAFSDRNYGVTVAEIVGLPDCGYIFEDYAALNHATIGCVKDYVRLTELKTLLAEHDAHPAFMYYDTNEELHKALITGEVELIAANSHGLDNAWKIIEKFCYSTLYFATWKGNEALTAEIDQAINLIELYNPYFKANLLNKYAPNLSVFPLGIEEIEELKKGIVYPVYIKSNAAPLIEYNEQANDFEGIIPDIMALISKNTGIKFSFHFNSDFDPTTNETAIHLMSVETEGENRDTSVISLPLLSTRMLFLGRRDYDTHETLNGKSVAIMRGRSTIATYVQSLDPNDTVVEYDTPHDCIQAVLYGKADLACLDEYVANEVLVTEDIQDVVELPYTMQEFEFKLETTGENSETITDILDTGIQDIEKDEVTNIIMDHYLNIKPDNTFSYFIKNNLTLVSICSAILVCIIIGIVITLTYAKSKQKEAERIKQLEQTKSLFFSNLSHDMRTPLNGIIGYLSLMKDYSPKPAELTDYIDKANSSSHMLLDLVNDSLNLSKFENNKITLNPVCISTKKLLLAIQDSAKISAKAKGINLIFQADDLLQFPFLQTDKLAYEQIFLNLISNAIKFTPSGGTVIGKAKFLDRKDNVANFLFTVSDTGIGMSPEFIPTAFEPFTQDRTQASYNTLGSGLGLSIVKQYVELMGGHIEVSSQVNKGSCFSVYLPVLIASSSEDTEAVDDTISSIDSQALKGKRILVAEDHPLNQEIIKKMLNNWGFEVDLAENGQATVDIFSRSETGYYSAILMDIRMPVMNGLDAAQAIRCLIRPDATVIPIIAMTANAFDEDRKKSEEAGMNAHLAKPINPQELYKTLVELIH